jgi:hypothetical protein
MQLGQLPYTPLDLSFEFDGLLLSLTALSVPRKDRWDAGALLAVRYCPRLQGLQLLTVRYFLRLQDLHLIRRQLNNFSVVSVYFQ